MVLATIVYYRCRILASLADALTAGILSLTAAAFLAWVMVKSVQAAPASRNWSLAGILIAGLVLMLAARYGLKSVFFALPREADTARHQPAPRRPAR
jgi:hypothetical protein